LQASPKSETNNSFCTPSLLTVREAALQLHVSESWIRRHIAELPVIRVGRLVRISAALFENQVLHGQPTGGKIHPLILSEKSLKSGKRRIMSRFQRGYIYLKGKKAKVWYGMFREDAVSPDGQFKRCQRKLRLGTVAELPTKNSARNKLADLMEQADPSLEMDFQELTVRWEKAEGPTMKPTTLSHYRNALRAYVLPTFGKRNITSIQREDIQLFLAEKANTYSRSALRSIRVVLSLTLGWAKNCGWLANNPCIGIKLPRKVGGSTVNRTALTPEQVNALAAKLEEPYATLVLFLYASGLRIGEAVAMKWSDFADNVLHVTRRICDGDEDVVKSDRSVRHLPVVPALMTRMRGLGEGERVFRSRTGTPVNPGNALKRYVKPAATELGISLGGWHDFRHSLTTQMRRSGVHPKVIAGILGHSKVDLQMNVYDRVDVDDLRQPLAAIASGLLPSVTKNGVSG
jgi:excisionase family DNA binding protein